MNYAHVKSALLEAIDAMSSSAYDQRYARRLIINQEHKGKRANDIIRSLAYYIMNGTRGEWPSTQSRGRAANGLLLDRP
jgi:hypothetical protein